MDLFNWMALEMITREQVRDRLNGHHLELPEAPKRPNLVKRMVASSLVGLALRLNPGAGERLGRLELPVAHPKGGN